MKVILGTNYFTIPDVASEIDKSIPTVYRLVSDGKLKGKRCGNTMLFTAEDITRFIDESSTDSGGIKSK